MDSKEEVKPAELKKRTWRYLLEPDAYAVCCNKGGQVNKEHKVAWSEYEGMIWCFDCEEDMVGFGGIFDGPIMYETTKMILGETCFHRYNMETGLIEAPQWKDGPPVYRVDWESSCKLVSRKLAIATGSLRKINLGRHGGMDATAMALEAWGALRNITGEE